jgi:hypothetical protein
MHEVTAMIDYKKPYYTLFNALSDAVAAMEKQNYGIAQEILLQAQQASEKVLISQKEETSSCL